MNLQRSSDKLGFQVSFPELDKPASSYRFGRRMFVIHKNMNSVGCLLGFDAATVRHQSVVGRRLRAKEGSRSQSALGVQPTEGRFDEVTKLRTQLREKEQELMSLRRSMETSVDPLHAFSEQMRSFSPPMRPTKDTSSHRLSDLNRSVELSQPIRRPTHKPAAHNSPPFPSILFPSNNLKPGSSVHELARLPFFSQPKYTRQHPKLDLYNPITGLKRPLPAKSPYA